MWIPFFYLDLLWSQETVMESLSPSDPNGQVTLIVERSQGTQSTVVVDWALDPLGSMDLSPTQGSLTFREVSLHHTSQVSTTSSYPGLGGQDAFCPWARHLIIIASLHRGVHMGTGESRWVSSDGLASCPGGIEIFPVVLESIKLDINTGLMSHIGWGQTFALQPLSKSWAVA